MRYCFCCKAIETIIKGLSITAFLVYNGIEMEKNFVSRNLKVDVGNGIFSVSPALAEMRNPMLIMSFDKSTNFWFNEEGIGASQAG